MRTHLSKTKTLFALGTICAVAVCAIGVAAIKRQHDSARIHTVVSKIKNLEVVGVTVEREGEPDATLAIIIRNNSARGIVALSVESGDGKDFSGISTTGFGDGDVTPSIILEPYGTIKMEMLLGNLLPGKPLKVSGVMYADAATEGEDIAKERLRSYKERAKARGTARS
ncbi:MAG TPA: hypothetical protein VD835_13230 [Pyrinomonadaceae bacterium]|nr:hypothetical protein [Pyrinomonadaceae bacterium]